MHLHAIGLALGYLGAALGVAMVVPQIMRTMRDRSVPGVSALSWSLTALACSTWLLYGVRTRELPQIPGNVLMVSGAVLIALAVPSGRRVATRAGLLAAAALLLLVLAVVAPLAVISGVAIAMAIVSTMPQTIKSLLRKNVAVSAVSPMSWVLRIVSQASWLSYAITLHDMTVAVSAVVILGNAVVVLVRETSRRTAPVPAHAVEAYAAA
jgi:uncharacterized protein with PQ loop repeat